MNNFVDEVLNGEPKYRVMNENNVVIHDNTKIEMVTPVVTQGTALNKAFFDSIKEDLNSRLLISSKATDAEAKTGTNDVKYMTSAKVKALNDEKYLPSKQLSIKTGTVANGDTIPQTAGYAHYLYMVSPKNFENHLDATTGHAGYFSGIEIVCEVNQTTRKVSSYTRAYYYASGSAQGWVNSTSCSATYTEIAWN